MMPIVDDQSRSQLETDGIAHLIISRINVSLELCHSSSELEEIGAELIAKPDIG